MGCKEPELSELCRDNSKHFTPHTVLHWRWRQISGLLLYTLKQQKHHRWTIYKSYKSVHTQKMEHAPLFYLKINEVNLDLDAFT